MSMTTPYGGGWPAIEAPLDARLAFIRRTYLHLAGAIVAFVILSALCFQANVGVMIVNAVGARGWLIVLGAFILVGWLAQALAQSDRPLAVQYAGLALYTAAQALIFSPMIAIANAIDPGIL